MIFNNYYLLFSIKVPTDFYLQSIIYNSKAFDVQIRFIGP